MQGSDPFSAPRAGAKRIQKIIFHEPNLGTDDQPTGAPWHVGRLTRYKLSAAIATTQRSPFLHELLLLARLLRIELYLGFAYSKEHETFITGVDDGQYWTGLYAFAGHGRLCIGFDDDSGSVGAGDL